MSRRLRLRAIIRATCDVTRVAKRELVAPGRLPRIVRSRDLAAYVARAHGHSPYAIGTVLGRDHPSVYRALARAETAVKSRDQSVLDDLYHIECRAELLTEKFQTEVFTQVNWPGRAVA